MDYPPSREHLPDPAAPVIVLGCQRSGTTLLASLLRDASNGGFGVEAGVIRLAFIWFLNLCRTPAAFGNLRMVEFLHALRWGGQAGPTPEREGWHDAASAVLTGYLGDGRLKSWAREGRIEDFLACLCRDTHLYGNPEARWWGDKYPQYLFQIDQIEQVFPRARFVFVYRHPHPVMESLYRLRNPRDRPGGGLRLDMADCRDQWTQWNRTWFAARGAIAPGRRRELAFEALVADPAGSLAGLERFLGLEIVGHPKVRRRLSGIDPGKIGSWRGSPNAPAVLDCPADPEFLAMARQLGYSLTPSEPEAA